MYGDAFTLRQQASFFSLHLHAIEFHLHGYFYHDWYADEDGEASRLDAIAKVLPWWYEKHKVMAVIDIILIT